MVRVGGVLGVGRWLRGLGGEEREQHAGDGDQDDEMYSEGPLTGLVSLAAMAFRHRRMVHPCEKGLRPSHADSLT